MSPSLRSSGNPNKGEAMGFIRELDHNGKVVREMGSDIRDTLKTDGLAPGESPPRNLTDPTRREESEIRTSDLSFQATLGEIFLNTRDPKAKKILEEILGRSFRRADGKE